MGLVGGVWYYRDWDGGQGARESRAFWQGLVTTLLGPAFIFSLTLSGRDLLGTGIMDKGVCLVLWTGTTGGLLWMAWEGWRGRGGKENGVAVFFFLLVSVFICAVISGRYF